MSDIIMTDGFPTLITFGTTTGIIFEERTVQLPNIVGGPGTNSTTMHNTAWRTKVLKLLKELTDGGATVVYSTDDIPIIFGMININQLITYTWGDGASLAFWGGVTEFNPGEFAEGEQPEADIVLVPTLRNNLGVETAPVYDDGVV